ncbi:MAG: 3-dehydroquinate synthase [Planctomycetaceae bacterium]|nr:3-dehydroquinate synthase [Planctomycetaceae bacterium]
MSDSPRTLAFDVPFVAPFVHRLRFTTDLLGRDQQVLADILEPSGSQPARVQFWIDEHLSAAHPELKTRLHTFARSHAERIMLPGNIQTVPGGEAVKNDIEILERMLKCIHAADLDRRSYIVVIGGGAVLDAVGLAAAVSHRGIRLVRIPTTTLAQADSGVGVKNSVNLFGKKNWCGTFAVPWAVINDESLLRSLPDRDFVCGFSEAVKVSLLKSPAIFDQLCRDAARIRRRDMNAAWPMIQQSARLHLDHITCGGDPFELREARPLDFGHWSAHKLEAMSDFRLRHGEAVAIGVAVDTVYASFVHGLPHADALRVLECLQHLGVPLDHPALHQTEQLFAGLEEFRQHLGGRLTLTMLTAIGQPLDVHEVDRPRMLDAIEYVSLYASKAAKGQSGRVAKG